MVQDFRPLNEVTADESYPVPDPYIALNNLSPNDKYFTVIDLANAFFTIKLHPESQKYFAFTVKGRQYTYCRMPQGWKLSPGYFNHFLRLDLAEFNLPEKCTLIQYVDDLAISGPDASGGVMGGKCGVAVPCYDCCVVGGRVLAVGWICFSGMGTVVRGLQDVVFVLCSFCGGGAFVVV
uniref:ribonuclease H n=1 Tax=Knipowitschia caucasica TaxID=637954 RepID=A0AAV2KM11_KNICA